MSLGNTVHVGFLLAALVVFHPVEVHADTAEPEKVVPAEGSRNESPAIAFDDRGRLWIAWMMKGWW